MALNSSQKAIIDNRRLMVARLRLRGITQREIQRALEQQNTINPADGKPWSLGTINGDIKALEAEWRERAAEEIDTFKAQQLAEIAEVKRQGWANKDLALVLRALSMEVDILGTKAPTRNEVTGKDGGDLKIKLTWGDPGDPEDNAIADA